MTRVEKIRVEVAYALPARQAVLPIDAPAESTVKTAIELSRILDQFPEIDLSRNQVGIFGEPCDLDKRLNPGDRVEIYRPLLQDPKEARRKRAAKSIARKDSKPG